MLMEKIESVIKPMRQKAHFYLKKDTSNIAYTSYDFKTRNYPSQCRELQNFQEDLLDTTKLIKFRIVKDNFQRKLKENISFEYKIITRCLQRNFYILKMRWIHPKYAEKAK